MLPPGAQRGPMRDAVRALGESADDERAAFGQLVPEPVGNLLPVARHAARTDDGDARLAVQIGDAPAVVEYGGRVRERAQAGGIEVALIGEDADVLLAAGFVDFPRVGQVLLQQALPQGVGESGAVRKILLRINGARAVIRRDQLARRSGREAARERQPYIVQGGLVNRRRSIGQLTEQVHPLFSSPT